MRLAVFPTHPIQYFAPVLQAVRLNHGIEVCFIYGSDAGQSAFKDPEFKKEISWDTDLLEGMDNVFLSRIENGVTFDAAKVPVRGMSTALKEAAADACLIPGYAARFYRMAFYHALKSRLPVLFRGDVNDYCRSRSVMKGLIRDGGLRLLYRGCEKILYTGKNAYAHYKRLGVTDSKLVFSPLSVNASVFRASEEDRKELRNSVRGRFCGEHDILLLYSGKLIERKGIQTIIQACKAMPPQLRDRVCVVFMGGGELEAKLKEYSALTPSIKSCFIGFKNQRELSAYYHAADLLILPSFTGETWGLVVNDALHHGLPCIVSDKTGCAPDLIVPGQTGEIFRTGDAADLCAAISKALSYTGSLEIRDRCRKHVSRYSLEEAARGIARACSEITKKERR